MNHYSNEQQLQPAGKSSASASTPSGARRIMPYFQVRNILGRAIIFETSNLPLNHAEYGDPIYERGVRGVW